MTYTKEQKNRMIDKLNKMITGATFLLNKNDSCPIKCKLLRTRNTISIVATELKDQSFLTIVGNPTSRKTLMAVVDTIEDYIEHLDLMVKQFFITKSRQEGYDI